MDINSLLNKQPASTIDNDNHGGLGTKSGRSLHEERDEQVNVSDFDFQTADSPSYFGEQGTIQDVGLPLENGIASSLSPSQQRVNENCVLGRMFRDRQRASLEQLQADVTKLSAIHKDLRSKCCAAIAKQQVDAFSYWSYLSADTSLDGGVYPVSNATAVELGVRLLTGPLAIALLEYVAERRNLTMQSLTRCTRSRASELLCPAIGVCEGIVALTVHNICKVSSSTLGQFSILDMMFALSHIHNSWAKGESIMGPFVFCHTTVELPSDLPPLKVAKHFHSQRCERCGITTTEPTYNCCSSRHSALQSPRGPDEAVFDERVFLPS